MKNKIVISIGSLLACIALVSVLIAAVGPPPILRNSMTTNQNVWEKSGSSMTWTGSVSVAGTVSASVATNATNVVTLGQMSPGFDTQVIFQKGTTNGTDSEFVWDWTNHREGIGATPLSKLDVNGGVSIGSYAGSVSAPANGLIVSGHVGIGNSTPGALLHIGSSAMGASLPSTFKILSDGRSAVYIGDRATYIDDGEVSTYDYGLSSGFDLILHGNAGGNIWIKHGNLLANATVNATNGFAVASQTGISTSEKVITQSGTTNLNVWVGGILVSNITNYHD